MFLSMNQLSIALVNISRFFSHSLNLEKRHQKFSNSDYRVYFNQIQKRKRNPLRKYSLSSGSVTVSTILDNMIKTHASSENGKMKIEE
jgi:hypothetical protein